MVNFLSSITSFVLSFLLFYILFLTIEKETITELDTLVSVEINLEEVIQNKFEKKISKNIEEETVDTGSEIGDLFEDSDYKKIARKIQRYDIDKIKTVDNSKPTNFNDLFSNNSKQIKNIEKFTINKEYSSSDTKNHNDEKKYLSLIHRSLLRVWITKPNDVGKKAKITFKISKNGSFVYKIVKIFGDKEFKSRLVKSLDRLKLSGFEPQKKYTVVTVNFIAKE